MKTITDIKEQLNSKKHCNVYLDGVFYCGLRWETVYSNRLKIGQEIEEKTLEKIQLESEYTHALDRAMGYLEKSAKTKKQVELYLKKKGYVDLVIDKVLAKLVDYRFINDESYAQSYIDSAKKNKGTYLIERELKLKGIDEKIIKETLSDQGDDEEVALNIAVKFLKGKEYNKENFAKVYRKLLSRGFSYETCSSVIEKLKNLEEN